jgi:predicted dehydrogenase
MSSIRIGLIGAGLIGDVHSAVLTQIRAALPGQVDLTAVADPDRARRERFRDMYGYGAAFGDAAELIAQADVDTVFICTPTLHHAALVEAAAARGLRIFCEKPLAMSYTEGKSMVDAVERAGVAAQIGLVLRYSAVYGVMRSLYRDARAGRPVAVVFRDDQCFPIRGLHDTAWRADRSLSAGGTLIEHGVHDLDLLTWFFGPMKRVRAWEANRAGHTGIEDYVAVEIELEDGLRAQLVNLWHDMLRRPSNRRLEIFCERGFVASNHDMSGEVMHQIGDGVEEVLSADVVLQRYRETQPEIVDALRDFYGVAYLVQDLAFVQALLAGRAPFPDMRTGLEAQRLAEAVYHSARSGHAVDVATFVPS